VANRKAGEEPRPGQAGYWQGLLWRNDHDFAAYHPAAGDPIRRRRGYYGYRGGYYGGGGLGIIGVILLIIVVFALLGPYSTYH